MQLGHGGLVAIMRLWQTDSPVCTFTVEPELGAAHIFDGRSTHVPAMNTFVGSTSRPVHNAGIIPDDHVAVLDPFNSASVFWFRYMCDQLSN